MSFQRKVKRNILRKYMEDQGAKKINKPRPTVVGNRVVKGQSLFAKMWKEANS
jgi:hypothetical protein